MMLWDQVMELGSAHQSLAVQVSAGKYQMLG